MPIHALARELRPPVVTALVAAIAIVVGASRLPAQQLLSLEGTVRNESGRPVEQAVVTLRAAVGRRETRTDADGRFRFLGVAAGSHELRVARIGFQPVTRTVELAPGGSPVEITLARVTALQQVDVVVSPTGVYGTVLTRDQLLPIPRAIVTLMGAREVDTTDAAGAYAMPGARPGTYMMRVSRDGFDTRLLSVRIPRDSGVGIDLVLKPGAPGLDAHMEMLWADLAQRINWRGANSAVVAREQLLGRGRSLEMALTFAPDFAEKGIRFDGAECLFVDGMPRPGLTVKDFDAEDIESVEVYGKATARENSEFTNTLAKRWPRGGICGNPASRAQSAFRGGRESALRRNRAQYVSIWLRK